MTVLGEHHNSNWSQARYYQRLAEEQEAGRQRNVYAKPSDDGKTIEADYQVVDDAPALSSPTNTESPTP